MQDNIPDALSAAFERHYDLPWSEPKLRNERLAWRAAWASAMEQANTEVQAAWIAGQDEVRSQRTVQCLHQIQEPTVSQQLTVAQAAPRWKLVPVEPQDDQQLAGAQAIRFDTTPINKMWTANKVYREMVAAAPTPLVQERKS